MRLALAQQVHTPGTVRMPLPPRRCRVVWGRPTWSQQRNPPSSRGSQGEKGGGGGELSRKGPAVPDCCPCLLSQDQGAICAAMFQWYGRPKGEVPEQLQRRLAAGKRVQQPCWRL